MPDHQETSFVAAEAQQDVNVIPLTHRGEDLVIPTSRFWRFWSQVYAPQNSSFIKNRKLWNLKRPT